MIGIKISYHGKRDGQKSTWLDNCPWLRKYPWPPEILLENNLRSMVNFQVILSEPKHILFLLRWPEMNFLALLLPEYYFMGLRNTKIKGQNTFLWPCPSWENILVKFQPNRNHWCRSSVCTWAGCQTPRWGLLPLNSWHQQLLFYSIFAEMHFSGFIDRRVPHFKGPCLRVWRWPAQMFAMTFSGWSPISVSNFSPVAQTAAHSRINTCTK